VVETEEGAPNGYAAPGLMFLAPHAIGRQLNRKVLANQVSRQWWEEMVSPSDAQSSVAHQRAGRLFGTAVDGALERRRRHESQARDVMVDALTVDTVPIIQSSRLEDYSPELWALTGAKGATVLNMLRNLLGDDKFFPDAQDFCADCTAGNRSNTDDFQKVAETVSKKRPGTISLPNGSNRAARRNSNWNTRYFANSKRASA
jgi:hypothetical protein